MGRDGQVKTQRWGCAGMGARLCWVGRGWGVLQLATAQGLGRGHWDAYLWALDGMLLSVRHPPALSWTRPLLRAGACALMGAWAFG